MSEPLPDYDAPHLAASITPEFANVGDMVLYHLEVGHPSDVSVKMPPRPKLHPYSFNGLDHTVAPSPDDPNLLIEKWTLKVGVYHLERADIPSLTLEVVTPDGSAQLVVPPQPFTVVTAMSDAEAKPREMAPPEKIWEADYTLLYVGGAALGAVVVALLGWSLVRRLFAKKAAVVVVAPPQPLEVRARQALLALQNQGLVAKGRKREFFFRLSEIVRGYLGERFGFDAMESTTTELLALVRDRPTPGLDYGGLRSWCEMGDLAKFAKEDPSDEACSQALTAALAIIDETTAAVSAPTRAASAA